MQERPLPNESYLNEEAGDDSDDDFGAFASAPPASSTTSGSPKPRSSPALSANSFSSLFHPSPPNGSKPSQIATSKDASKLSTPSLRAIARSPPQPMPSPPHVDLAPVLPTGDDDNRTDVLSDDVFAPFGSPSSNGLSVAVPAPVTPYEYAAAAKRNKDAGRHHLDDGDDQDLTSGLTGGGNAIVGFDTLDPVQRYAVGALSVVLLRKHARDLNDQAFVTTHVSNIMNALCLSQGQQAALFLLSPANEDLDDVVQQCVELVGDESTRFHAVQAMLALAVAGGVYDARSRAFLCSVANTFGVPWRQVAAIELAIAIQLFDQADFDVPHDFEEASQPIADPDLPKTAGELMAERRRKKQKAKRVMKVGGITLVGGILFGVTGGIIAPALLSALAGVGVASAAGLAASGSVASGAVVGSLFGVAGAGVTQGKARKRTLSRLEEFDFERPDDPRVIEEKEKRLAREAEKQAKEEQLLLKAGPEEPETLVEVSDSNGRNAVEDPEADGGEGTIEKLERIESKESNFDPFDDQSPSKSKKKKQSKHAKVIVGSQGLEAAGHVPSLHLCICVPAWLNERRYGSSLRQFEDALKEELPCSQHIALRWESRRLYEMGLAFAKFWASKATVTTIQNAYPHAVAAASSVAGAIAFAFALPLTVLSCLDYIDNPWSVLVSLSNTAGEDLADVLVARSYGNRPVTLFGYSIGARVIFKCLESLASRNAYGIVDNVFLMSAPVSADPKRWMKIRPVVAGRIVNGYGIMDWALAFFHRGCGHGVYVSGLRAVELESIENLNMSYIGLEGHKELKDVIPRAMRAMGVGRGYISVPPAKIVRHHFGASNHGEKFDVDPVDSGGRNRLDHPATDASGANSIWGSSTLEAIPSKKSVEKSDRDEPKVKEKKKGSSWMKFVSGERNRLDHPATDASGADAMWASSGLEAIPSKKSVEKSERDESKAKDKKKSSSWMKLSSWSIRRSSDSSEKASRINGNHGELATIPEARDLEQESDIHAQSIDFPYSEGDSPKLSPAVSAAVETSNVSLGEPELQNALGNMQLSEMDKEAEGRGTAEKIYLDDHIQQSRSGAPNAAVGEDAFDWDLQRRIWEQQELQLRERGFADDAEDIEMSSKVLLGIGVEVAGLRIHPFIDQDVEFPVAPVLEYFTNCCADQRGLAIRVYEHEKRKKSLPLNPLRQDKKYPKLLGEVELTWTERKPRADARFAVSVEVTEEGEVVVEVYERHRDGNSGESKVLRVPRLMLCTTRERAELDAQREKDKQLLLPAPS